MDFSSTTGSSSTTNGEGGAFGRSIGWGGRNTALGAAKIGASAGASNAGIAGAS